MDLNIFNGSHLKWIGVAAQVLPLAGIRVWGARISWWMTVELPH